MKIKIKWNNGRDHLFQRWKPTQLKDHSQANLNFRTTKQPPTPRRKIYSSQVVEKGTLQQRSADYKTRIPDRNTPTAPTEISLGYSHLLSFPRYLYGFATFSPTTPQRVPQNEEGAQEGPRHLWFAARWQDPSSQTGAVTNHFIPWDRFALTTERVSKGSSEIFRLYRFYIYVYL